MKILLWVLVAVVYGYKWEKLENVLEGYVRSGGFPGTVVIVGNSTDKLYQGSFGHFSFLQTPYGSPPMNESTIFDIASLTKVTGTLSCIMKLVDEKILHIDDLVIDYIEEYNNNGKQDTTIQNLLLHNAGLLPDYPGDLPSTKQQVMDFIYNCKLEAPVGEQFVYSDLSFILLGEICQRVMGGKLSEIVKENLQRLEMFNTSYLPPAEKIPQIAPTEFSTFRNELVRGKVHDPTAYLFGGVAGHAGLFSVADDLFHYMQIHLNNGTTASGKRVYSQEVVRLFYTRVDGLPYENRRALGWDTVPIQPHPPCGHKFSLNSFGHTGYTGTMMWVDRDKDLIIVFLTNRVHPTSLSQQILQARMDVSDTVVDIISEQL